MSSEKPQSISSLITEFLDQPPSCLEFCPQDPDYFVIGTYLLHEEKPEQQQSGRENASSTSTVKQTKTGTLQLWHLNATTPQLQEKQVVTLSHAVFDLHFHPRQSTLLGIAGSDGTVSLYSISCSHHDSSNYPHIQHIWTRSVHDEDPGSIPSLYLTWFPKSWFPTTSSYPDGFAVTFADGRTSVFSTPLPAAAAQQGKERNGEGGQHDIAKGNGLDLIETQFEAPNGVAIEAWFVALASYTEEEAATDDSSIKSSSFIFTGDDFGSLNIRKFCAPDEEGDDGTSSDLSLEDCMISDTSDRARHHTAGVTAILPLPIMNMVANAPILLTGSYDEYIRVYHANSRRGTVLAESRLGGGVWRLQVIDTEEADAGEINFLVLASCMHAGTRVVKVTWKRRQATEIGDWDIQVLAQFTEHESMNYASGFWKGNRSTSDMVCVSTSFYDKRLCLWKLQL
ncbi:hypothetical protein UA08_08003 [Talaromyces atroroseus]|uniref:methylated diphthine methylhydrolase n=1 Tax=Talaromyces atroroseus TaxID=1441469 RepID=A0A225AD41_TALAT|nr:hypothetical protein UA08_08003 [Talaromyces atroroseus]OKL56853.1 hypothetical protein UA08_08003 [Talaromyces atroroseus]